MRIWGLSILLFVAANLSGQEVRFQAYTDAREIIIDSYVQVTFKLENAQDGTLSQPPFKDFLVLSGPNTGRRTSIVNGQVSRELTFSYTLQPKKVGNLTIEAASIKVGNKSYKSQPISIKVIKGGAQVGSNIDANGRSTFIRAEISDTVAYIGQQLVLDYKWYSTADVESFNILREPTYEGFFAQRVRRFDNRRMREVINGQSYFTRVIRRVILYPQQSGQLEIDPMQSQLAVLDGDQRNGLWFSRRIKRVPGITNALNIEIKPLPEPKPDAFTGTIGRYQFRTAIDKTDLSTDDALSLRLIIRGTGDSKRILAPDLDLGEGFDVYEPRTVRDETYEVSNDLTSEKEFAYAIAPLKPGKYRIQPSFTYFDVDSSDYVTLNSRMYLITVSQGSRSPGAAAVPQEDTVTTIGMRGPKAFRLRSPSSQGFLGAPSFWALSIIPFIALLGFWWKRKKDLAEAGLDPAVKRRRDARKQALQRLSTADQHRQSGDSSAFYDEISRAMLSYVSDKLRIPPAELSKANVSKKLSELGVAADNTERFSKMLKTAEMALYAGMDNADSMQEVYQDAVDLLGDIEAAQ